MDTYNRLNDQFGTYLNHLLATYIDPSWTYQEVGRIIVIVIAVSYVMNVLERR